ncbi:OsmC family protein [Salibacterium aidingense]|uniref:OsmC family protein n=1 Tax=Salibacterium aidingense TaxID=384933 RepID=UPI003BBB72AF
MSGALDARQIPPYPDKIKTTVQGTIEAKDGVMRITNIDCHYDLKIPKGKREAAERVLNVFEKKCPVAQTLKGNVSFHHSWTIEEYE